MTVYEVGDEVPDGYIRFGMDSWKSVGVVDWPLSAAAILGRIYREGARRRSTRLQQPVENDVCKDDVTEDDEVPEMLVYICGKRFSPARKAGYSVQEVDDLLDWAKRRYASRTVLIEALADPHQVVASVEVEGLLVTDDLRNVRFQMDLESGYEVPEVQAFLEELKRAFEDQDAAIALLWRQRLANASTGRRPEPTD